MKTTRLDQLIEAVHQHEEDNNKLPSVIVIKGVYQYHMIGEIHAAGLDHMIDPDRSTIQGIPMRRSNDIEEGDFEIY